MLQVRLGVRLGVLFCMNECLFKFILLSTTDLLAVQETWVQADAPPSIKCEIALAIAHNCSGIAHVYPEFVPGGYHALIFWNNL